MAMERITALETAVAELAHELARQQDIQAINKLQQTYGYCMDKWLFDDIVDLFAEDSTMYFMDGVFKGRDGARRLYGWTKGKNGPQRGILGEHMFVQGVVDVAADRSKAWGRWRCLLLCAVHESRKNDFPPEYPPQFWEGGINENEYVRENGIWKFKTLRYRITYQTDFTTGPATSPAEPMMAHNFGDTYPTLPMGPDELRGPQPQWPNVFVLPFHYQHPVTGRPIGDGADMGEQ
jgi:hypothetical protein